MASPSAQTRSSGRRSFGAPARRRRSLSRFALAVIACSVLGLNHDARCQQDWEYTVKPGDTLWALTERYLSDLSLLPKFQELNGIADPHRMTPGTRLRAPLAWLKSTPAAARFVTVHGDVQIEDTSSSGQRQAAAGLALHAGEIVRTQPGAYATVEFFDGSVLGLYSDSVLRLTAMRAYAAGLNAVNVELAPGRAEARVRAAPRQTLRFEIQTPAGITSVRGTDWRVSVPEEKLSRVEVLAGEVVVAAAGKEVSVPAGYGSVIRAGEPPAAPLALLPQPDLRGLPASLVSLPAEIEFPAVPGAAAYRAQLASGTRFENVVFEAVSDTPRIRVPELPNGQYVLRVRAVHVAGLEGLHSEQVVELAVRLEPPRLLEPQDGAESPATPGRLRWSPATGAVQYRFQLARDATFSEPILDLPVRDPEVTLDQSLPSGLYYWRVAATPAAQGEGPFSPAYSFRQVPASPKVEQIDLTPAQIRLRWSGDRPDRRYHVQLARDLEFTQVVIDTHADSSATALPRPSAGAYFLRVRAVEPDGYEGPSDPPTPLEVQAPPAAPRPLHPPDASQVSGPPVVFHWEAGRAESSYRLQLADNPAFDPLIVDASDLTRPEFKLERALAPGSYFWRVAASTPADGEGGFSTAQTLRRLPLAPGPLAATLDASALQLRWEGGLPGGSYEIQLARDEDFRNLLTTAKVSEAFLRIPRPAGGRYYARLRTVDAEGFPGPFSPVQPVDVRVRPSAPRLAEPQDGALVAGTAPELRWHAQQGAARYRVQLAADSRFTTLVFDRRDLESTSLRVGQALEPGVYLWRVSASTESDGEGAFSEARTLRVPPAIPALAPPEVVSDRLVFRWRGRPSDHQYHLQLAKDGEFRELVLDRRVRGTELSVPRPSAGRYFARLCAQDADGVAGSFSEPQAVQVPARFPYWMLPLLPLLFLL